MWDWLILPPIGANENLLLNLIVMSDSSLMLKGPGLIFKFTMVENSSAFWILN